MTDLIPFEEEFILIGQKMADEDGVVLLVGKPKGSIHMREMSHTRGGEKVLMSLEIEPGFTKVRAATFADGIQMLRDV